MRRDHLYRHLVCHKETVIANTPKETVERFKNDKLPFLYIDSKNMRTVVCLVCTRGKRGATLNRMNWIKEHKQICDYTTYWERFSSHFENAGSEISEDPSCENITKLEAEITELKRQLSESNPKCYTSELESDLLEAKEDAKHFEQDCMEAQKESLRSEEELYRLQDMILFLPDHILNAEPLQNIVADIRTARAEKESKTKIVRSAEVPVPPLPTPSPPQKVIQKMTPAPEPRNEIRYEFESEDIDDNASDVSASPMEHWDMENEHVAKLFWILSDILEQGMSADEAKQKYSKILKSLRTLQKQIGKPYCVLRAYLNDLYTAKELDCFMTVYE